MAPPPPTVVVATVRMIVMMMTLVANAHVRSSSTIRSSSRATIGAVAVANGSVGVVDEAAACAAADVVGHGLRGSALGSIHSWFIRNWNIYTHKQ